MQDPYAILGVSKTASTDEIRRAYRKLAKELHPDARPDDKAAEDRFKEVTAAFKLLSDPEKRAQYDRGEIDAQGRETAGFHFRSRPGAGASARGPRGQFEDIGDIFSELFTDFGTAERTRRARPQARRGADIRRTVDVSFEEAVTGTKRRIDFQPGKAVDVTIPAGVEDGQVLRLKGLGHPGGYGGPAGAGLVEVKIRPHPFFRREGDDIRVDLPITLKEALQGGKVRAPTVEGPVEVRVPEGTSSGALLRLRGKGVPKPDGTRGDQIVRLMIDIPVNDPQLDSFVETWTPPADYDPRKRFRRSS
ncbi:J domain-containing protein [Marinicauda algicola]|uniref:J domain-containing protein n=1 Tax=Marinicauda algicola TaxID=2029849 RepID=A0A4S2H301_9PROT|nr:J domain-containing protein [Marinicauda algicola]TGY89977.1 J domain-containing protein [Marinicauda algicola]